MKQLEAESKLVSELRCQIHDSDTQDQETRDLHQRLTDLQVLIVYTVYFDQYMNRVPV